MSHLLYYRNNKLAFKELPPDFEAVIFNIAYTGLAVKDRASAGQLPQWLAQGVQRLFAFIEVSGYDYPNKTFDTGAIYPKDWIVYEELDQSIKDCVYPDQGQAGTATGPTVSQVATWSHIASQVCNYIESIETCNYPGILSESSERNAKTSHLKQVSYVTKSIDELTETEVCYLIGKKVVKHCYIIAGNAAKLTLRPYLVNTSYSEKWIRGVEFRHNHDYKYSSFANDEWVDKYLKASKKIPVAPTPEVKSEFTVSVGEPRSTEVSHSATASSFDEAFCRSLVKLFYGDGDVAIMSSVSLSEIEDYDIPYGIELPIPETVFHATCAMPSM